MTTRAEGEADLGGLVAAIGAIVDRIAREVEARHETHSATTRIHPLEARQPPARARRTGQSVPIVGNPRSIS